MAPNPKDSNRYLVLDGLRGVAAFSVMFYHFCMGSSVALFPNATVGVDLFFMLSGFVLAHAYATRFQQGYAYSAYLYRVLTRLYPMLLAGCVLGMVALFLNKAAGFTNVSTQDIVMAFVSNALFLPYLHTSSFTAYVQPIFPTNHPAWSLFFQLTANILLLPLLVLQSKRLLQVMLASFAALMWLGYVYASSTHQPVWVNPSIGWDSLNFMGGFPRVLFSFTLGMLLQRLLQNPSAKAWLAGSKIYQFACKVPFLVYALALGLFSLSPTYASGAFAVLSLLACPLVILLGAGSAHTSKTMSHLSTFLSWISYPLYCVHMPVGWLVDYAYKTKSLPPALASLPQPALSSIAAVIVTIVLVKLYEEPLRTLLTPKKRA